MMLTVALLATDWPLQLSFLGGACVSLLLPHSAVVLKMITSILLPVGFLLSQSLICYQNVTFPE